MLDQQWHEWLVSTFYSCTPNSMAPPIDAESTNLSSILDAAAGVAEMPEQFMTGRQACGAHDGTGAAPDMSAVVATFDSLPLEVAAQIFRLLDPCHIKHARLVCRGWLRQASMAVTTAKPKVSKIRKLRGIFPGVTTLDLSKAHGVAAEHMPLIAAAMPQLQRLNLKRCNKVTDEALLHLRSLTNLRHLSLARCLLVTDAGVASVAEQFPRLRSFNIKYSYRLTDHGMQHAAKMTELEALCLTRCRKLMNGAMEAVATLPNLTSFKVSECDLITDEGLTALSRLQKLTLLQCKLSHQMTAARSDTGWAKLFAGLPALRNLQVTFEAPATDASLAAIAASLTALRHLHIDRFYALTDAGAAHLLRMPSLTSLHLHETRQLTDAGLTKFAGLANLRVLVLSDQPGITDAGIAALGGSLPALDSLHLRQCDQVCGTGVAAHPFLTQLELSMCALVSDDSLYALAACRRLASLNLTGCGITDAALPEIAALAGLTSLVLGDCQRLRCELLWALAPLQMLQKLDVNLCRGMSESTMHTLQDLDSLQRLNASMCPQLTDAGLEALAAHLPKRLRQVNVAGCEFVTKQGATELEAAIPQDDSCYLPRNVEYNHQQPDLYQISLLSRS